MSDYTVISAVSQTLHNLLHVNITSSSDSQLNGIEIELISPKEMQQNGGATGVSVWLYKINRMAEMLNDPPERRQADKGAHAALPIVLHYLITPMGQDPSTRHTLLGRVLQVFNDHAILRGADLQGTLRGTTEQIRVSLENLTLDELSQVWYALSEPYQLSVTYLVQVVKIDSDRELIRSVPVVKKEAGYAQILSAT